MSRTEDRLPMKDIRFSDVVSVIPGSINLSSVVGVQRVIEEIWEAV